MPLVTPTLRMAATALSAAQPLATAPKLISVPAGKETAKEPELGKLVSTI